MHKKAQVEKALTFPVLILIIIIMAAFLFLASVMAIKSPVLTGQAQLTAESHNNLLLQQIEIEWKDQTTNALILIDLVTLLSKEAYTQIKPIEVEKALKNLLDEKNNCLYLEITPKTGAIQEFDYIFKNKEALNLGINNYEKIAPRVTKQQTKDATITHYYGSCDA